VQLRVVRICVDTRRQTPKIPEVSKVAATSLGEKLECLRRPETFPDDPERIEVIETHFAWLFLSRRFAYKLKKPLRSHGFDFTTLEGRRANCELEVALNRRLAEAVYIGVVPLGRRGSVLALEADSGAVDWLVKMHRLPAEKALDQAAEHATLTERDLAALVEKLARFYGRTLRAPWDGPAYRRALTRALDRYAAELSAKDLQIDSDRVHRATSAVSTFIRGQAEALDARIASGRVVDAHGDLRPEHIFLAAEPQIIDCLEFAAELRLLDTAEEIAFLKLECERIGYAEIGAEIEARYRQRCADDASPSLLSFYRAQRAIVRALLSAWHLRDGLTADAARHWRGQAHWYLDVAAAAGADALRKRRTAAAERSA
jgi:aminoglycoside phosphotransferase family enzyme